MILYRTRDYGERMQGTRIMAGTGRRYAVEYAPFAAPWPRASRPRLDNVRARALIACRLHKLGPGRRRARV